MTGQPQTPDQLPDSLCHLANLSAEQSRIAELERLVGQLTFELAAVKNSCTLEHPLARKREVIAMLTEEYPVRLLCELLACTPSSYYYRPR